MPPLTITIIGAGIAGLTAAIALRKQGHTVTLLEKGTSHQESGSAMMLTPNCSSILHRLGFSSNNAGAVVATTITRYRGDGSLKRKLDLTEISKQWSSPWYCAYRPDLHRELRRLVLDPDGESPVPEILMGCVVIDIDVENGTVISEDGRAIHSDAILGADGNFSFARSRIDPTAMPHRWGKTCYRWIVSRHDLLADPEIRDLVGEDVKSTTIAQGNKRVVMYPCRNNTVMNFVAYEPSDEAAANPGGWNRLANKATMMNAFQSFSPAIVKLLGYAPKDIRVWQLYDLKTLRTWTKGRLALLGDAAHPVLPFLGQGGAMAIEDAASIAQLISKDCTSSEIPQRLELYESIRHERVALIQEQTRLSDLEDQEVPPNMNPHKVLLGFCYGHDEWEHSRKALQELLLIQGKDHSNVDAHCVPRALSETVGGYN